MWVFGPKMRVGFEKMRRMPKNEGAKRAKNAEKEQKFAFFNKNP